jgi:hypothetical protein
MNLAAVSGEQLDLAAVVEKAVVPRRPPDLGATVAVEEPSGKGRASGNGERGGSGVTRKRNGLLGAPFRTPRNEGLMGDLKALVGFLD